MPQIFRARPLLRVRGMNAPPGVRDMPVMVRNSLAGGANFPGPNGNPGAGVWPYSEGSMWGDGATSGGSLPVAPPPVGTPPPALTQEQQSVISTPYGQSSRLWNNPTTYAGFPITIGDGQTQSVLNTNPQRNSLIIQNLSTATAPDVASTLYVGFNSQPTANNGGLALPPGLGFYWGAADCPPRDNIIVAFFGISNGGGTVILAGSVIQGTYLQSPA